jgi:hypothetical protein
MVANQPRLIVSFSNECLFWIGLESISCDCLSWNSVECVVKRALPPSTLARVESGGGYESISGACLFLKWLLVNLLWLSLLERCVGLVGAGMVERGGCGEYQLQTCDHFNKFLMLEEEFSLVMIAHHPDTKIEDIIANGITCQVIMLMFYNETVTVYKTLLSNLHLSCYVLNCYGSELLCSELLQKRVFTIASCHDSKLSR